MLPSQLQNLITQFTKLPGIGPRQAARFIFYLLRNEDEISSLADTLRSVRQNIKLCANCFLPAQNPLGSEPNEFCAICANPKRDQNTICVVEKETDALNFEKIGQYQGHYYVLGGFINPLEKESLSHGRLNFLVQRLQNQRGSATMASPPPGKLTPPDLESGPPSHKATEGQGPPTLQTEIILALSPRREGDFTSLYIEEQLKPLKDQGVNIKITRLGRGLSSGAELEYADEETLKNALKGRK